MIRKLAIVAGSVVIGIGVLFFVSSRKLSELTGYCRATADTTVDNLTEQIPDTIHDRKMENELRVARQQLIDRQVDLNLSRSQVGQLRKEVEQLAGSVARRQRLLGEAYPVMKDAVDRQRTTVRFASTEFSMADFQKEVDDLMAQQQRESRQLEIKRDGLARLEKSLGDGERALTEMRGALETLDQEVAVLKSRREQAQVEAATMDLVSSATAGQQTAATNVGQSVDRMKQDVQKLEARLERTTPVGAYPANPWGLHDVVGTVWEWVWDGYDAGYYGQFTGKVADNPRGSEQATDRVLRGGGWYYSGWLCRPANRSRHVPGHRYREDWSQLCGLRLALGRSERAPGPEAKR